MTITPGNFFDLPADRGPERVNGAPQLIPRGLEAAGIRSAYSRASSLSEHVENQQHIHRWEMRYLAKAMGQNEDLAALAAVERYSTGVSDALYGREKSQSGRNLDEIIARALDRVRIHEKADRGTAIHGATEPGAPAGVSRFREPVDAFWEINRRQCIRLAGTEVFTANDTIMSAGTFDHLIYRIPGHGLLDHGCDFIVGDKKTGSFSPFEWCIQISSYANGEPYNLETDARPGWPGRVCTHYGLVWQIDADTAEVKLWVIDIDFGWEMAQVAAKVRDAHKRRDIAVEYKAPTFAQRLEASSTPEELRALWSSTDDLAQQREVEQKARTL